VNPLGKGRDLRPLAHTTKDGGVSDFGMPTDVPEVFRNLDDEFACRRDDQTDRLDLKRVLPALMDLLKDGNGEGSRFSCARLGAP